jgi:hypothetical protein
MRTTIVLPCSTALLACLAACGDATAVEPGATDSTGAASTAGPTGTTTPTGSTAPEPTTTASDTTAATSTGELPGTSDTSSAGEVMPTTTGTTVEASTTGTTAGETDDTAGVLCGVDEDTVGPPVDWARHFGSPGYFPAAPRQLDVGPLGQVAIAQPFQGEWDLGGGPMQGYYWDGFFTMFDAQGEHLATTHLDVSENMGLDGEIGDLTVAFGPAGDVYVAGSFSGTLTINADNHVAPYGIDGIVDVLWLTYDVLLVKFAPDGTYLWSKRFGDEFSQEAFALAIAPTGDIVVGGPSKGITDFGGGPLGIADKTTGFLAAFTPDGDHLWSRSFGPPYAYPVLLSTDPAGRISMAGFNNPGADLGGGPLAQVPGQSFFLAQFDAAGKHRWSRPYLADHDLRAMVSDASGAVMVTGHHYSPDFVYSDMNLARFAAADGKLLWNKQATSPARAVSNGVVLTLDLAGNVVVGGNYNQSIDLGDGPIGDGRGMFLAGYDGSGGLLWQRQFSAPLSDFAPFALASGPTDELVFTGILTECTDLGFGAMTPVGIEDLLLVRLSQ